MLRVHIFFFLDKVSNLVNIYTSALKGHYALVIPCMYLRRALAMSTAEIALLTVLVFEVWYGLTRFEAMHVSYSLPQITLMTLQLARSTFVGVQDILTFFSGRQR